MVKIGKRISRFLYGLDHQDRNAAKRVVFQVNWPLGFESLASNAVLRTVIVKTLQGKVKQLPNLIDIDALLEVSTRTISRAWWKDMQTNIPGAIMMRHKVLCHGTTQIIEIRGFVCLSLPSDAYRQNSHFYFPKPLIFSLPEELHVLENYTKY